MRRSPILAGSVGGAVEWYDFAIYGTLAPSIAKAFFPAHDPLVAMLATFGIFAIGFAARPVGAVIFGYFGDRFGRRVALLASVLLMGVCTALMAVLPTYTDIGVLAPAILTLLRVAQGLSVGGEFSSASVYLAEHAPPARRGFLTAITEFATVWGFLLGALVGAITAGIVGEAAMADWGWRIPFALGGVLALAILFVRSGMPESPVAEIAREASAPPLFALLRNHWRELVHLTALTSFGAICFYTVFVYATSFQEGTLKIPTATALDINTLGVAVMAPMVLLSGFLSDRWGRRRVFFIAGAAGVLLTWPLFGLLTHDDVVVVGVGQVGFGLVFGFTYGVIPATIAELFPTEVRCSGWLVATTGNAMAPAFYLIAAALMLLVATVFLKERAGTPLTAKG